MPLPFLVVALVGLALGLGWLRLARARGVSPAPMRWSRSRRWTWAVIVALAALWPLWTAWPIVLGGTPYLPGDAASHARVALEIARHGLPHGWIESYSGGFPMGPHYQSAALLTSALLIHSGTTAHAATWLVGLGATLLLPVLFLWAMRAAEVPAGAALLGAIVLAWISPVHTFIGGPAVMLSQGLVAQALGCGALVCTAIAVLDRRWPLATLMGALSMAAHAQLAVCALLACAPTALWLGSASLRRRFGFAAAGAVVVAVAVYLPGALHFTLPFSWAKVPAFRIVGYGPERLGEWILEGALLDAGRAPILSACLWLASIVAVITWRSRASRAVLSLFVTTLLLSAGGTLLNEAGSIGARIVEIYSPARMLCLLPLTAAALVSVATAQVSRFFAMRALGPALVALLWLLAPGRDSAASLTSWKQSIEAWQRDGCRSEGWSGYREMQASLAELAELAELDGGRFVVQKSDPRTPCPVRAGVELSTTAPLGTGTGGPGSQLGVLLLAFDRLAPERPGGWARAEAMGVRSVLHRSLLGSGWQPIAAAGQSMLSVRRGGTGAVGVGCIEEEWTGADRAIRDALFVDLDTDAPRALVPHSLVRLRPTSGEIERSRVDRGDCDARDAVVRVHATTPGERRAEVQSAHPVDVVLRSTYLPTWEVRVDGRRETPVLVAPGFLAVRVAAGTHRIEARVAPLPFYVAGLCLAALALALLVWREQKMQPLRS